MLAVGPVKNTRARRVQVGSDEASSVRISHKIQFLMQKNEEAANGPRAFYIRSLLHVLKNNGSLALTTRTGKRYLRCTGSCFGCCCLW
jgi:hypothetical protein